MTSSLGVILPSNTSLTYLKEMIESTDDDINGLRDRLADAQLLVASLEDSITAVSAHRTALLTQKRLIYQQQLRNRPRQSPFATTQMPEEILSSIFVLTRDLEREDYEVTKTWHSGFVSAPIFISGTCGSWRRVALKTSKLWSFIQTEYWEQFYGEDTEYFEAPMLHFLKYSGEAGLAVSFEMISDTVERIRATSPPLRNLPVNRIHELQLRVTSTTEKENHFNGWQAVFPAVSRLTLIGHGASEGSFSSNLLHGFPALQHLSHSRYSWSIDKSEPRLDVLTKLTCIEVASGGDNAAAQGLCTTLSGSRSTLRSLVLQNVWTFKFEDAGDGDTYPQLERIELASGTRTLAAFLARQEYPKLAALRFTFARIPLWNAFIQKVAATIMRCELVQSDAPSWSDLYARLPNVTVLVLDDHDWHGIYSPDNQRMELQLQALVPRGSSIPFPKLAELRFTGDHTVDGRLLFRVVEERQRAAKTIPNLERLQRVVFAIPNIAPLYPPTFDELSKIVQIVDGLQ